ncbi:MAG: MMPL family transporter, partial [Candidatus Nealsonbacteria bacterium]|nr:MMPL family transporter [Candidatus Nealsonbacteria bacterium]
CLFVAGFGGVRHPLMTVAALLLAMGWSFGYITLAVGHLNILSISFGVILIGLGIDFGVHYVARYLQLYGTIRRSDQALVETARGVGPGILTGAVTTAIAFMTAGLTEFTGVAELGMIAGGGILLCLVAALTVLPAMIYLADRHRTHQVLPVPLDLHGWLNPLFARPGVLLAVTLVGTAAVALGMNRLWYDHNLLNLQPEGIESVELQRKLIRRSDEGLWFALSITQGPEEAKALKRKFERLIEEGQLPAVDQVKCLAELFPSECEKKRPTIEAIHARLATLPERAAIIPVDRPAEVGLLLARAQTLIARETPTYDQVDRIRRALRLMPEADGYHWLAYLQQRMAGDLLHRLHELREMSDPEPPDLDDLPEGVVARFVGRGKNKHLLQIYPKGDIWEMPQLKEFVRQVRSVDPNATGNPLQTYEASLQMQRSYKQAAWYALAAILLVLYADFRSLRHTLLAMVPLGLGMLQLFGMLGLLGVPLNPANMIVLPLILGIGIDDGVHVVHDFRRQPGRYRMSPSTASGVLITSLTTMVGFGSLMIASHRGLQSLGRVLTIGVSCCLFTSLVMLPAMLALWTRHRAESPEPDQTDALVRPHPRPSDEAPIGQRPHRRDPSHPPGPTPATPAQRSRLPDKTW